MTSPPLADSPALKPIDLRAISRAAVVTALGLVLPPIFHALHLGHVFLPMYLPILGGAFLLPVRWAVAVGAATPLLSCLATGMPPLMPPWHPGWGNAHHRGWSCRWLWAWAASSTSPWSLSRLSGWTSPRASSR